MLIAIGGTLLAILILRTLYLHHTDNNRTHLIVIRQMHGQDVRYLPGTNIPDPLLVNIYSKK